MCRMVFAFGKNLKIDQLVDDFRLMALDQNEDHERNQGKKGTFLHKDGWGAAYLENGQWSLRKSIKPCYEDEDFLKLKSIKTSAIMIHTRHASKGSVKIENTHPFEAEINSTDYVFCHNGGIEEVDWKKFKLLSFKPQGDGDTEQLFYHILNGEISKEGIERSLSVFENYAAMNFILARKGKVFAATWFREPRPLYYQMKIIETPAFTIISSEILKSFGRKSDWKKLENKKIVERNY